MDTIASSVLDTGGFWQRASDGASAWQGGGEEEEAEDDQQQGIDTWEGGSLSLQDSELVGSDEFGYSYNSYGYVTHDEWGGHIPDPDMNALPARRGEKRRSDSSLSADGFDTPQTPNSPLLQASSSKMRNAGTGSLFFKTKLCIKFKAGTCPYNSSCNFAHGMDELRKPPPGWEDMVGIQDMGVVSGGSSAVPSSADSLRFRRTRRCKKYYSEEGCPYGERCNFLHDDQAKARESNAISLGPATSNSTGGGGAGIGIGGSERPSNWKTRMCNKWEMTGHCPFGQKCNFAHGLAELQMYAGAPSDVGDARATPGNGVPSESKLTVRAAPKTVPDVGASYASTVFVSDGLNANPSTLRHRSTYSSASKSQKQMKVIANWRGPADEISTIYGDWIEEDE